MPTSDPPLIGTLLRRLRTAAALSQEALAERAGVSVRAVSDLERGVHRAPRLETVRLLADALGLGPSARAELIVAARPRTATVTATGAEGLTTLDPLPSPPTRLIGREAEVSALSDLLAAHEGRLLTLTGAGGTGKTRLALAVAAATGERYRDGVYLVDLSPLTSPVHVLPAIATALRVREVAGQQLLDTVGRSLRECRLLLLLDNCEHVLGASAEVAALLAACPHLVILATSRVPLHIRAEREVEVAPLPLPDPGRLPALSDLEQVAAVALFVERAQAVNASLALTADNAAAVAGICQRLDGLPLAIELAAARIKAFPPAVLLARLEERLPLLTGGGRDLPTRQRTMRDAIAWSYDLLSAEEQRLFRHLAVFVGGCTLAAAEAVAGPEREAAVFDGIVALIDQSLLRQTPGFGDEPRYLMLETLREYGLERLQAVGDMEAARVRHAAHFLKLTGGLGTDSRLLQSPTTMAPFTADRHNLHLALTWFDLRGEIDALVQLSIVLFELYFAPGLYREARYWLERSLELSGKTPSAARIQVLMAGTATAVYRGDYDQAARYSDEGLALARELGDPLLIGTALAFTGWVRYRQADYRQAEAFLAEAHRQLRALVDRMPAAVPMVGIALLVLGDTALAQEQFVRARRPYEEGSELFRTLGDDWRLSDVQAGLGGLSYCTGDYEGAAAIYAENLARAQQGAYSVIVASSLIGLAGVAAATGQPEVGARVLGAAEASLASLGAPIFPRDRPVEARVIAALTAALGEEGLASLRDEGRALHLEEAIAEAMASGEVAMGTAP